MCAVQCPTLSHITSSTNFLNFVLFFLIHKFKCRAIACWPAPFPRSFLPCTCCFWPFRWQNTQAYCHTFCGQLICSCLSPSHLLLAPTSSILHLFSDCNQEVLTFLQFPIPKFQFLWGYTWGSDVNESSMNTIILPLSETISKPQTVSTYAHWGNIF